MKKPKIAIIGTGALGTTLAYLILINKHELNIFEPNHQNLHNFLTHKNIQKFPNITTHSSLQSCITEEYDYIFPCIPSKYIDSFYKELFQIKNKSSHIISISKGLYPQTTQTISQYVQPHVSKISVLSGPTFANEILDNMPTTCTIATSKSTDFTQISQIINTNFFTSHYSPNIVSTELCGILKNCYAITLGIIDHYFAMNTKSLAIIQITSEVESLIKKMKLSTHEITSFPFLGDLIATGLNPNSRNTTFGSNLKYQKNTTIEGADNINPILELAAKYKIKLPILTQTNQIIINPSDTNISRLIQIILST